MRKVFIHGENVPLSRRYLDELKLSFGQEAFESIDAEGLSSRRAALFERKMFDDPRYLLVEFFEKEELRRFDIHKFSQLLDGVDQPQGIVLWFGFELGESLPLFKTLKQVHFEEKKFDLRPQVFALSDAFFAPRSKPDRFFLGLSQNFDAESEGLFLIQLLIKRARQLFWQLYQTPSLKRLHPFVQKKLSQNRPAWNRHAKILNLYEDLVRLDGDLKSREVDLPSRLLVLYEKYSP